MSSRSSTLRYDSFADSMEFLPSRTIRPLTRLPGHCQMQTLFVDNDASIIDTYWDPNYIQHNPFVLSQDVADETSSVANLHFFSLPKRNVTSGLGGLKSVVAAKYYTYDIGFVFSNGNLVATHSLVTDAFGGQNAIVDIFRVDKGRIVEHWDLVQPVPATTASGNPMVDPTERSSYDASRCTESYEATARGFGVDAINQLFGNKSVVPEDWVAEPYVQHNPSIGDGVAALKSSLKTLPAGFTYQTGFALAKCNTVLVHSRILIPGASLVVADIYRINKDGKGVEHWDAFEVEVPAERTASGNPMFAIDEANLVAQVDQSLYGPVGKYATVTAGTPYGSGASSSASAVQSSATVSQKSNPYNSGTVLFSASRSRRDYLPFSVSGSIWNLNQVFVLLLFLFVLF
ncbi:hypothetical protein DFJ73DRAFT_375461 [Zopfochytrium polystomum]|nr:hypothetical protein DFJ73DRAFT_375461 [Zopfochytrium polystomum]